VKLSSLCKKGFQLFKGFLVKVMFCDKPIEWERFIEKQLENKQEMKDSRFMKWNNRIN
jgi:hypothetical protein